MKQLQQSIHQVIQECFDQEIEVVVTHPEPQFGDYATNVALQLAKPLGRNPREIAEKIVDKLHGKIIDRAEVAGPGFINIWLSDEMLAQASKQLPSPDQTKQTIVIETNNPNPFKAMHIGHAFNAILADTIANLLEMSGQKIYRVSYHGDVGLHVGKSMYSLLKYCKGNINRLFDVPENERNSFMSRMYAEGSKTYKDDSIAKRTIDQLAQESFTRQHEMYAKIYDIVKGWSFEEIDDVMKRLGNVPIERRFLESEADHRGVEIVKNYTPLVFKQSNGAYVFEGSKYGSFDNVFVSSTGRGLYGARDLGLVQLKHEYYHPQKSYIVTAEEQRDYFKGVLAAAELCFPDQKNVTVNISHGTVKLSTGKMSSRDGDVIEISWLFDQIAAAIKERGGEPSDELIAGALRYQFLRVRIGVDVVFDVNDAVSLHGNSGPYLQYAHARACSILEKSNQTLVELLAISFDKNERVLMQKLSQSHEVIEHAARELTPHIICHYLYELAQNFNRFYENSRIIDDPRESERLAIVQQYRDTIARGLAILGIHAPTKM